MWQRKSNERKRENLHFQANECNWKNESVLTFFLELSGITFSYCHRPLSICLQKVEHRKLAREKIRMMRNTITAKIFSTTNLINNRKFVKWMFIELYSLHINLSWNTIVNQEVLESYFVLIWFFHPYVLITTPGIELMNFRYRVERLNRWSHCSNTPVEVRDVIKYVSSIWNQ